MTATLTLEMIDPATLTVDVNVREDAALTPDFIASIKEHGVMEPVIAHRKEDGVVHVLMGQRRTRAAVEAGRDAIPVMIIDSPEEAERIVTQVVENIQRAELTEADEAEAYHQLSLIGVSAAAIAKKTGRTKTTVESALKAKSTDTGSAALGKGHTIEEALILAKFESDEEATAELESVIMDEPDMLLHVTEQLRDKRDRAAALAALTAELEEAGTTVVPECGSGHTRIGFITCTAVAPSERERLRGFRDALGSAGLDSGAAPVVAASCDAKGGYETVRKVLDGDNPPSALFCCNDPMAMGAYRAAADLGWSIPGDLSVIGFGDQELIAANLHPALTSVALPHYEMGAWAAERLIATVEGTPGQDLGVPEPVLLGCPLLSRGSVAAPRIQG